MFDSVSVLERTQRRFGRPAAVSLGLHLLAIAAAIPLAARIDPRVPQQMQPVTVMLNPRPRAAAAAPQGAAQKPKPATPKRKIARRPAQPVLVTPVIEPIAQLEAPPELPAEKPPEEHARPDGMQGGMGSGTGSLSTVAMLSAHEGPVEYDEAAMSPPERLSGPNPEYTYLARAHDVQGVMVVKCTVTTLGVVRKCRVLQGLPYMDQAVIDALERRRYLPARLANGSAVEVDYTFHIRLKLH
jgi:protein TonB